MMMLHTTLCRHCCLHLLHCHHSTPTCQHHCHCHVVISAQVWPHLGSGTRHNYLDLRYDWPQTSITINIYVRLHSDRKLNEARAIKVGTLVLTATATLSNRSQRSGLMVSDLWSLKTVWVHSDFISSGRPQHWNHRLTWVCKFCILHTFRSSSGGQCSKYTLSSTAIITCAP